MDSCTTSPTLPEHTEDSSTILTDRGNEAQESARPRDYAPGSGMDGGGNRLRNGWLFQAPEKLRRRHGVREGLCEPGGRSNPTCAAGSQSAWRRRPVFIP